MQYYSRLIRYKIQKRIFREFLIFRKYLLLDYLLLEYLKTIYTKNFLHIIKTIIVLKVMI